MVYLVDYLAVAYLSVSDRGMCARLRKLGMVPCKSHKDLNYLEVVPEEFRDSFVCGYIDGDGSIVYCPENWTQLIQINGCVKLMDAIVVWGTSRGLGEPCRYKVKAKTVDLRRVQWAKKKDVKKFCEIYLSLGEMTLDRKRDLFQKAFKEASIWRGHPQIPSFS